MHLRSITLKGFKSFPDRTRLEFGPGVSVIVGPNGSGKSNITDAVLWAMGEQSPLAVRGQSMQDVIFAGATGQQARSHVEVELVLDNSDRGLDIDFAEVSILRRLDRSGEGEYRINGARCRLIDVLEILSDTGLGKEMHSIVSQGRVEAVVTSKPRDRRLLIEEAAGLGKHRKRRRRAQLKLERTQENLDRALDVEREARSRLRPLKRQAEAAEIHERLQRQTLEARWELARDSLRLRRGLLAEAEEAATGARSARDEIEQELGSVAKRREAAERALTERGARRDELARRSFGQRSAAELVALRVEQVRSTAEAVGERLVRAREALRAIEDEGDAELLRLRGELAVAESGLDAAHAARTAASESVARANAEVARVEAELTAVNEFVAARAGSLDGARTLADELDVEPGCELAVAAALGGAMRAPLVADLGAGNALLDRAGAEGGAAIVSGGRPSGRPHPPAKGAEPLLQRVAGGGESLALASVLLADAWLVESLEGLPDDFVGIAVTRAGRSWHGKARQLRQAPRGGDELVLAQRNRRTELVAAAEHARRAAAQAASEVQAAAEALVAAEAARDDLRRSMQSALRRSETEESVALRMLRAESAVGLERRAASDEALLPVAHRLRAALEQAHAAIAARGAAFEAELVQDSSAGEQLAVELRTCAQREAELQRELHACAEAVTTAEVGAQQSRDQAADADSELGELAAALGLGSEPAPEPLGEEERGELEARIARLERRREQLGPVNPLAQDEYRDASEHVEDLERQRKDLDSALRELQSLIAETDRRIREAFETTFEAAAANFEEVVGQLFPGGRGRLRLVREDVGPRRVLGGQQLGEESGDGEDADVEAEEAAADPDELLGVEIEMTPAGKSMKRLSLLSGGEKSLTALAFLFAIFLARPCPFYVLDEVEAALDDLNIDRFLTLLRRNSQRAQFIVVTHQKRTMEAADTLYGVSMSDDGVSKVISQRLPRDDQRVEPAAA